MARRCSNCCPTMSCMSNSVTFPKSQQPRLLLSCGAAAAVSAGFNAPIAGVFFALEVFQSTFSFLDEKNSRVSEYSSTAPGSISAVLLSSVLSALVSRQVLQDRQLVSKRIQNRVASRRSRSFQACNRWIVLWYHRLLLSSRFVL